MTTTSFHDGDYRDDEDRCEFGPEDREGPHLAGLNRGPAQPDQTQTHPDEGRQCNAGRAALPQKYPSNKRGSQWCCALLAANLLCNLNALLLPENHQGALWFFDPVGEQGPSESRPDPAEDADCGPRPGEKKPREVAGTRGPRRDHDGPQNRQPGGSRLLREANDRTSVRGEVLGASLSDGEIIYGRRRIHSTIQPRMPSREPTHPTKVR